MEKIVKFRKNAEKPNSEKERERYKRDFQEYLKRREAEEKMIYLDTRKRM